MNGYETYEAACEAEVSRKQARWEISKGDWGMSEEEAWELFLEDVGDRDTYTGKEVLDWMGY